VAPSTIKAILGQRVAPGFGDWYAAKTAYQGQQTDEPENPSRPDNLWGPVDAEGDVGAHGPFDGEARRRSFQLWVDTRRGWLTLAAAGLAGIACAMWLGNGRDHRCLRSALAAAGRGGMPW
jgi:hypothetical protein